MTAHHDLPIQDFMIRSPFEVTFQRIPSFFSSTASTPEEWFSGLIMKASYGSASRQGLLVILSEEIQSPAAGQSDSVLMRECALSPVGQLGVTHLHDLRHHSDLLLSWVHSSEKEFRHSERSGVKNTLNQIPAVSYDRGSLLDSLWISFPSVKWVK